MQCGMSDAFYESDVLMEILDIFLGTPSALPKLQIQVADEDLEANRLRHLVDFRIKRRQARKGAKHAEPENGENNGH